MVVVVVVVGVCKCVREWGGDDCKWPPRIGR